jgi:broad specificity phosphatase PhoE
MAVEIVYETHSVTRDNERGIATGWLDGELSEEGKRLAHDLGARRRNDGIAVVYTSDLGRAVETAEIAFGGSGIPIHRDARLRECNYGELNGSSVDRVSAERRSHIDDPFPGGESHRQVVDRTHSFLDEVCAVHDGERILVIAHGANRLALDHLVHGTPIEELVEAQFDWQPGWLYVLRANTSSSSAGIE